MYCRSTTAPHFDDDFWQIGERAARDEGTGKTYYVPADMTYKDWHKSFAGGRSKDGLQEIKTLQQAISDSRKVIDNKVDNSKITSGAISGALDPDSERAEEHAKQYYALVRKMTTDIYCISRNTGFTEEQVQTVKEFIFLEKHDLGDGRIDFFDPSYQMAESWRRLIEGKDIQPHDITLLNHEIMERQLMLDGCTQDEAHRLTSEKYNYKEESDKYYASLRQHKKTNEYVEANYIPEHTDEKGYIRLRLTDRQVVDQTLTEEDKPFAIYFAHARYALRKILDELDAGKISEIPESRLVMWY